MLNRWVKLKGEPTRFIFIYSIAIAVAFMLFGIAILVFSVRHGGWSILTGLMGFVGAMFLVGVCLLAAVRSARLRRTTVGDGGASANR